GNSLLKDSFPCPIPTCEKDAHRAPSSNPTLPIGPARSTRIIVHTGCCALYPKELLQKHHDPRAGGNTFLTGRAGWASRFPHFRLNESSGPAASRRGESGCAQAESTPPCGRQDGRPGGRMAPAIARRHELRRSAPRREKHLKPLMWNPFPAWSEEGEF